MKIEILEISPVELIGLLDTQNPVEIAKLLIHALALQMEKIHMPELKKEVANELTAHCEDLVFNSDLVQDAILDAEKIFSNAENDVLADLADYQTDQNIKQLKGE